MKGHLTLTRVVIALIVVALDFLIMWGVPMGLAMVGVPSNVAAAIAKALASLNSLLALFWVLS